MIGEMGNSEQHSDPRMDNMDAVAGLVVSLGLAMLVLSGVDYRSIDSHLVLPTIFSVAIVSGLAGVGAAYVTSRVRHRR